MARGDKIANRMESRLGVYDSIVVREGNHIEKVNRIIEELFPEQYREWSIDDLTNYIRGKYGNVTCHIVARTRARRGNDWINLPKLLKYETSTKDGAYILSLQKENADLRARVSALEKRPAEIADERDEDAEEPDVLSEFLADLLPAIKPILKNAIAGRIAGMLQGDPPTVAAVRESLIPHSVADELPGNMATGEDEIYETSIPDKVIDFLETVDWATADPDKLIDLCKRFNILPLKQ